MFIFGIYRNRPLLRLNQYVLDWAQKCFKIMEETQGLGYDNQNPYMSC